MLIQNAYKINHIQIGCKSDSEIIVNEYYKKTELSVKAKSIINHIANSQVVIINNYSQFKQFFNLEDIKTESKSKKFPIIINQKFEVYIPELKKYYNIFEDKEILSFSGILGSLRPQEEYIAPNLPKISIFEIVLKVIYISIYVNLSILNKLDDNIVKVIHKPFLNLIYIYFTVFRDMIMKYTEELDKGINPLFPKENYNYFKTKDNKYITVGNLENKFKKNFDKVLDTVGEPKSEDRAHNYFLKHNRDELFVRVKKFLN